MSAEMPGYDPSTSSSLALWLQTASRSHHYYYLEHPLDYPSSQAVVDRYYKRSAGPTTTTPAQETSNVLGSSVTIILCHQPRVHLGAAIDTVLKLVLGIEYALPEASLSNWEESLPIPQPARSRPATGLATSAPSCVPEAARSVAALLAEDLHSQEENTADVVGVSTDECQSRRDWTLLFDNTGVSSMAISDVPKSDTSPENNSPNGRVDPEFGFIDCGVETEKHGSEILSQEADQIGSHVEDLSRPALAMTGPVKQMQDDGSIQGTSNKGYTPSLFPSTHTFDDMPGLRRHPLRSKQGTRVVTISSTAATRSPGCLLCLFPAYAQRKTPEVKRMVPPVAEKPRKLSELANSERPRRTGNVCERTVRWLKKQQVKMKHP